MRRSETEHASVGGTESFGGFRSDHQSHVTDDDRQPLTEGEDLA